VRKLLAVVLLFFLSPIIQAQDEYGDSLKAVLAQEIPDTTRVKTLIELSKNYLGTDLKLALQYANAAKSEARKANYGSGLAYAYKYSGIVYYFQSQYIEALDEWQQSLHIFDSIQDKLGMANILSNIGAVYFDQGENTRALENYLQSLRLSQQVGDQLRIATAMINIGAVYFDKPATHKLALEYYLQALEISEKIEDIRAIGTVSVNIGEIYLTRGDDYLAQQYFQKALDYCKGTDIEPSALLGLGAVEKYRKQYQKGLDFYERAYETAQINDNLIDAARSLIKQAEIMSILGDPGQAVEDYKAAMPIATQIGANKELKDIFEGLASVYSTASRYDSAFKYLELLGNIKDTLFNIAADKRLTVLRLDFELEKKESEIAQLTTEKELKDTIIQRAAIIRNLIILGLLSVMVFLYIALRQKRRIEKEKQRSEELLLNILPAEIAEELKATGHSDARHFSEVTVLFTDFMDFTGVSQVLGPQELVLELNTYFKAFDEIITRHGIEKIKTIGDAYMAAGGVPKEEEGSITNVIIAAIEMQEFVLNRQKSMQVDEAHYFKMRVGIHTGSVVAGIVGVKKFQYDIWGDTVNTASRMESSGEHGKVNISQDTYDRIKHLETFTFTKREKTNVKGKGEMQMYFVWKK
jgi:class 3 adenylate cyclase